MEKKRYQVFVSSTFTDLKDERQVVMRSLLEIDCIPTGMELFPAADEEQFEFIKKVIDDCDYYIVIVGGRYGSVTKDGISYTEKEYDYARQIGLRVLAFLHEEPETIPVGKSEIDADICARLEAFKKKLMDNRLVDFWKDANDLDTKVIKSVIRTIKVAPAIGWIRGNTAASSELLEQVNNLRIENEYLKKEINKLNDENTVENYNLSDGEDNIIVKVLSYRKPYGHRASSSIKTSWNEILFLLGPLLFSPRSEQYVASILGEYLYEIKELDNIEYSGVIVEDQSLFTLRMQLIALGYIQVITDSDILSWFLTKKGQHATFQLRTITRSTPTTSNGTLEGSSPPS